MKKILRVLKFFFKYGIVVLLLLALYHHKLVRYGIDQLRGQLHIIWNAKPVAEVLADSAYDSKTKEKLVLINQIRQFAFDSLELKKNQNYSTFYDQHNEPVLWVLTASESFRLKEYEWKFPVIGSVGYKGFFKKEKGTGEFNMLKSEGYDVDYSPVSAWSTLGWFKDPILSNMLKRSPGTLAELIIHELTHGTIYLKSNVDFNENFATFVGEQGAIRFLNSKYGSNSAELENYLRYKSDESVYGEYINRSAFELDSLYNSLDTQLPYVTKLKIKYQFMDSITKGIPRLPLFFKDRYIWNYEKDSLPDNTYFLSFLRYRKKQNDFEKELSAKYHNNLVLFIKGYKN